MADERTSAAQSTSELDSFDTDAIELIDDVEAIDDGEGDDASTGQYAPRHTLVGTQFSPTMRPSSPPPVPPEARQSRPPAPPNSEPPSARTRSQSGMFRIERPSELPPVPAPVGASEPPPSADDRPAEALSPEVLELRETRAYVQRLRLMIRLREDRIHDLETALRAQQGRVEALAQQLAQRSPSQPVADDLKRIAGIGPKFERALHAAGIISFRQIAEWSLEDVQRMAEQLRTAPHRIVRDRWVENARELMTGAQS